MRVLARAAVGGAVVGTTLVLAGCSGGDPEGASTADGPVIASGKEMSSLPAAGIRGPLTMSHGCLLVSDDVAVWPKGTAWDADRKAVAPATGGDAVPVGSTITGAGAVYDSGTDFGDLFGSAVATDISDCLDNTGASGVRLVVPD